MLWMYDQSDNTLKAYSIQPDAVQEQHGSFQPSIFQLHQNYPNPFNPSTVIEYQIPTAENVSLKIFDMLGREVATLVNERKSPGTYEVMFDGSRLASGMYFYRLQAGNLVETKKLVLLR
jgi:glucuronoarabinoxylan endo-1,4-beta-xylanase